MPKSIDYDTGLGEMLRLIDSMFDNVEYKFGFDFYRKQKILSNLFLKLSLEEYNHLPDCLKNCCFYGNDSFYITNIDCQKKDILRGYIDDWQLIHEKVLRTLHQTPQSVLSETLGFRLEYNVKKNGNTIKHAYCVVLDPASKKIYDVIRVLSLKPFVVTEQNRMFIGRSIKTGILQVIKVRYAEGRDLSTEVLKINKERYVLQLRHELFGVINVVNQGFQVGNTMNAAGNKYINFIPYCSGEALSNFIKDKKRLSSWQKKLVLVQIAIELSRTHSDNIAHFNVQPDKFLVSKVDNDTGMVKVKLIGFDYAEYLQPLTKPKGIVSLYVAPEIACYHAFFDDLPLDIQILTSHDIRKMLACSKEPRGIFVHAEKQVSREADVYSFGNMLYHDYDIRAPFVLLMLDPVPTLRPTMEEVILLLIDYFIEDMPICEEKNLLITLAQNAAHNNYNDLCSSLFAMDQLYCKKTLQQQIFLLFYQCRVAQKLKFENQYGSCYNAFFSLKFKQLSAGFVAIQSQLPQHTSFYLLTHPKEFFLLREQKKRDRVISEILAKISIMLDEMVSQEKKVSIMTIFKKKITDLTQKYTFTFEEPVLKVDLMKPTLASASKRAQLKRHNCYCSSPLDYLPKSINTSVLSTNQTSNVLMEMSLLGTKTHQSAMYALVSEGKQQPEKQDQTNQHDTKRLSSGPHHNLEHTIMATRTTLSEIQEEQHIETGSLMGMPLIPHYNNVATVPDLYLEDLDELEQGLPQVMQMSYKL